jgi:hypothetical protein
MCAIPKSWQIWRNIKCDSALACVYISQQFLPVRMLLKPLRDSLDFRKVLFADLVPEQSLEMFCLGLLPNSMLPEIREYQVNLVLQVPALQNLPLIPVKPDAAAVSATVQRKG